jgi:hypothetical protein
MKNIERCGTIASRCDDSRTRLDELERDFGVRQFHSGFIVLWPHYERFIRAVVDEIYQCGNPRLAGRYLATWEAMRWYLNTSRYFEFVQDSRGLSEAEKQDWDAVTEACDKADFKLAVIQVETVWYFRVSSQDAGDAPALAFANSRSYGVWPAKAPCGRW